MKLVALYLKQRGRTLVILAVFAAVFAVTFALYGLPLGAVAYPTGICIAIGLVYAAADIISLMAKHRRLLAMQKLSPSTMQDFPPATCAEDEDYRALINVLLEERAAFESKTDADLADMTDYYTIWVHQIKTPIAAMKLSLQNEDSASARRLSAELFRIEQYVEMVLAFLRLGSSDTDYIIKEYELDNIVRQSVKKFAGEFIARKIRLEYEPLNASAITDEKWLSFVIEQLISNALKYTPEGYIRIYLEAPKTLCIEDSGIGIAPEDQPRVFEKGYTGYNGRSDKKASGIGLYICKSVCGRLGHGISLSSVPDRGTTVRLNLEQEADRAE